MLISRKEKLKDFFSIIVFAFAMSVVDNATFAVVWPFYMESRFRLLQSAVMPIVFICLVDVISIGIVAFTGGAIFRVRSKIVFLGVATYIFVDWLIGIERVIFQSVSGVGKISLRLILFMSIDKIILFLTMPFVAIGLCYGGMKLRSLIKKGRPDGDELLPL